MLFLTAAGCFGNTSTEFPAGLEPLEDNEVPAADEPSETLEFVQGERPKWTWVHGRGYFMADPGTIWSVVRDAELMAAVCAADSHSIELDDDPDYELSYMISYVVDEVINVAWDEQWRYGTIEGTPEAPTLAMVRYQKVFGSELIQVIEGSLQLKATDDPDITEIELVEHVAAAGGDSSDMRQSMQMRFNSVIAAYNGDEQPPCP